MIIIVKIRSERKLSMARKKDNKAWITANCKTCNVSFEMRRSKTKIYCSKKCSNADPDTKSKIANSQKSTFIKKYGMHPMQTDETKKNLKNSLMSKYGVEHYSKHVNFREKVESTLLAKYGDKNYNNLEKRRSTSVKKYGVDNYSKSEEYKTKYKQTCNEKYGVDHYSLTKNYKDAHKKAMFDKFLKNERFVNFIAEFTMEEYCGVTNKFNKKYPFKCKRCDASTECFIDDGKAPRCSVCDSCEMSTFQSEIYDFIKNELRIECSTNDRQLIFPKEIDIYIPHKKIGIECNGIYWHSEVLGKKNKTYHINKTLNCIKNGIHLIHIYENEWNNKKTIIKSILRNILNCNTNKLGARKCTVREIDKQTCKVFLNENHLQGNDHSSVKYGLFHDEELVGAMTFCKSRFDKNCEWELSRYCNKINYTVNGAANKLFFHFLKTHSPRNVVTYSDRKIFDGGVYLNMGFKFVKNTTPGYYYIIDNYKTLKSRMGFQKHKLKNLLPEYDSRLSEWENMKNHGYDRIWDCGHSKWIYNNSTVI